MATTKNIGLTLFEGQDYVSRETINGNYEKIDTALGIDFVCERGKSGDWEWVKWDSGFMEQWISDKAFPTQEVIPWGQAYSTHLMSFGNYPIAFKSVPLTYVTYNTSSTPDLYASIGYQGGNSTTAPRKFYILSDTHVASIDTPHCGIYARGYYK